MRRLLILLVLIVLVAPPVSAFEYTAPEVTGEARKYMPEKVDSFSKGLWEIIKDVFADTQPELLEAAGVCVCILGATIIASMVKQLPGGLTAPTDMVTVCIISIIVIRSSNSMIQLGIQTVEEINAYGKLLLPVMTAALAAQGGVSTSAAVYTGATVFIGIVTSIIVKLLIPLCYIYICLSIASCAFVSELLDNLLKSLKWLMTWTLKISVYLFTGYITVTGVVSGSVDSSAIKATKLVFSGILPVVGSIMSDASETVLVSASVMKNAAGVYGILAVFSILFAPFVKIGMHYLLLKITAGFADIFCSGRSVKIIREFTTVLGFVLGIIGTVSIMMLISTVCFMKGVS